MNKERGVLLCVCLKTFSTFSITHFPEKILSLSLSLCMSLIWKFSFNFKTRTLHFDCWKLKTHQNPFFFYQMFFWSILSFQVFFSFSSSSSSFSFLRFWVSSIFQFLVSIFVLFPVFLIDLLFVWFRNFGVLITMRFLNGLHILFCLSLSFVFG